MTNEQKEMIKNATYSERFNGYILPATIDGVSLGRAADIAEQLVDLGLVVSQSDVLTEKGVALRQEIISEN